MTNFTLSLAAHRPVLFSVWVSVAFVVSIILVAIVQKTAPDALSQEALGAVGRAAITAAALFYLTKLGWRRWIAGGGSATSWLIILPPLLYVMVVYPLLFTGTHGLTTANRALLSMVAANGFMAGVMEELIFRGLVLGALLFSWGVEGRGLTRALIVSSLLFSVPHALNVLAGADPLTTTAQLIWALLLGLVFGALVVAGGSVWPVAVLHGVGNAYVHANRYGYEGTMDFIAAALLALAPVPLLWYSSLVLRHFRRLRPGHSTK